VSAYLFSKFFYEYLKFFALILFLLGIEFIPTKLLFNALQITFLILFSLILAGYGSLPSGVIRVRKPTRDRGSELPLIRRSHGCNGTG
jgi:hypothetical protein